MDLVLWIIAIVLIIANLDAVINLLILLAVLAIGGALLAGVVGAIVYFPTEALVTFLLVAVGYGIVLYYADAAEEQARKDKPPAIE